MGTKIIAEFYNIPAAAKRANPGMNGKLEIVKLGGNLVKGREVLTAFYVENKKHARRLAFGYDATPWNF